MQTPTAQAGSAKPHCPGPCADGFLVSPQMEMTKISLTPLTFAQLNTLV